MNPQGSNFQLVPQQSSNINPKARKQYTISKQRENWTEDEHQKFLEALTLYDRDWKKIEQFVGTKTVIQIRSHAQKYFLKVQRNNTGERIPPPRPKRKSIQPYPQKQKIGDNLGGLGVIIPDSLSNNPYISSAAFANWMSIKGLMPNEGQMSQSEVPKFQFENLQHAQKYIEQAMASQVSNRNPQNNHNSNVAVPSFPKIYSFLSGLFDSSPTINTDALNSMTNVDKETMQVLMHNLAINLANQQFRENHQSLVDQFRSMKRDEDENDDDDEDDDDDQGGQIGQNQNSAHHQNLGAHNNILSPSRSGNDYYESHDHTFTQIPPNSSIGMMHPLQLNLPNTLGNPNMNLNGINNISPLQMPLNLNPNSHLNLNNLNTMNTQNLLPKNFTLNNPTQFNITS